jgi:hypothetical protein
MSLNISFSRTETILVSLNTLVFFKVFIEQLFSAYEFIYNKTGLHDISWILYYYHSKTRISVIFSILNKAPCQRLRKCSTCCYQCGQINGFLYKYGYHDIQGYDMVISQHLCKARWTLH